LHAFGLLEWLICLWLTCIQRDGNCLVLIRLQGGREMKQAKRKAGQKDQGKNLWGAGLTSSGDWHRY